MNTPRWYRPLRVSLTIVVVLIQLLSPLSVLAEEYLAHEAQTPPSPPLARGQTATVPTPPLSAAEAEAQVMMALQGMLNLPSDAPAEVVEGYQTLLDNALTRYAEALQRETPPSPQLTDSPPSAVGGTASPSNAPTMGKEPESPGSDQTGFLWYMEAKPAPGDSRYSRTGASWLLTGKVPEDPAQFDASFSRWMEASLNTKDRPFPEAHSTTQTCATAEESPPTLSLASASFPEEERPAAQADLWVDNLSHSPNPINATQQFTMAFTVHNTGPSTSQATVQITQVPYQELKSSTPSSCTSPGPGDITTCYLGNIEPNNQIRVQLTYKARAEATSESHSQVEVSSSVTDPNTNNNTATFPTLIIQPYADLTVTSDVPPWVEHPSIGNGDYTIVVTATNNGPSVAEGIIVTHTIPNADYVDSIYKPSYCAYNGSTSILTCTIEQMGIGTRKVMNIRLKVKSWVPSGTILSASAQIAGEGEDPGPGVNETSGSTQVTTWSPNLSTTDPGTVYALVRYNGDLFVGGTDGVLRWQTDGSWLAQGNVGGTVYALIVVNGTLYAGGTFGVKKRKGHTWIAMDTLSDSIHAFALHNGTLYAGGDNHVWRLNGTTWSSLPLLGQIRALVSHNGSLYAGGVSGVFRWTGSSWIDTGAAPGVKALASTGNDLYAGGTFPHYMAWYDGSQWHPVPGVTGIVNVLAAQGTEVYAGGEFSGHVARWNGVNKWTVLSRGTSDTVYALLVESVVYAGGQFTTVDSVQVPTLKVGGWREYPTDLVLTKTVDPPSLYEGGDVEYTITIRNTSGLRASHVSLRDTLPPGFTFVSASSPTCAASAPPNERVVICENLVDSLNANSSTSLTIRAKASTTSGTYRNWAVVGSDQPEPTSSNNNAGAADVTVLERQADLRLTKRGPSTTRIGQQIEYQLTVRNAGSDTATNIVLTDTLPADVTYISVTPSTTTCNQAGQTITCTLGDLYTGSNKTITLKVQVANTVDVGTFLQNTATVQADQADPNLGNNTSSVSTEVIAYADLSLSKTGPSTIKAGESLTYEITVTNHGPNTAENVTVTDTLPSNVTFLASQSDQSCNLSGAVVVCTLGTMTKNAQKTVNITVKVASDTLAGTTLENHARVGSDAQEDNPGDEEDTLTTTVQTEADISLAKSAPATANAGQNITYRLTVTNTGPSLASGVVLTDDLPAGVAFVSVTSTHGNCAYDGGTHRLTCSVGTLDANVSAQVNLNVTISETLAANTTLVNWAGATSNVTDPTTPNLVSASTRVETSSDLVLTKGDTPDPVNAGDLLTYTLSVLNNGPSQATNIRLTDPLPQEVTYVSVNADKGTCTYNEGTHQITCSLAALASGARMQVTLVVRTLSTMDGGQLINTASVTSDTPDPTTPNSTSETTQVNTQADLALTKSASPNPVDAGEWLAYTLVVTNQGPSRAKNVVLTDPLPANTSFSSVWPDSPTCTYAGGTVTCNLGNMDRGSSRTVTIMVRVSPDITGGTITNNAAVHSSATDPVSGNNEASVTTNVQVHADVEAHKTGPSLVYIAGHILYQIHATNKGPSRATGVVLTDTLPPRTSFAHASPGCVRNGNTITCAAGALAPGASTATYTITVTLDQTLNEGEQVENQVTVSTSTPDPNGANDTASASTTVTRDPTNLQANLSLTKSGPATVYAGGSIDYTLIVCDEGALDASDVTLVDTLPANVAFDTATSSQGSCDYNAGTHQVTCALGALANGSCAQVNISVTVPTYLVGQTLVNEATVSAAEDDWAQDNNQAHTSTQVTPSADLSLSKNAPTTIHAGERFTYHITIQNHGPNDAPTVVLTDTLPTDVTFVSATFAQTPCTYDAINHRVLCTLDTLATNASASADIVVEVPSDLAAGTPLTNTATVGAQAHEAGPGDETAVAVSTVQVQADLSLHKEAAPDPVDAGAQLTYVLEVTNLGPSRATNIRITDTLPAEVAFVSVAPGSPLCSHSGEPVGGTVTCTMGTLYPGGKHTVTIVVQVRDDLSAGSTLTNRARAYSTVPDPTPANNEVTLNTPVQTNADLEAHKRAPARVYVKGRIRYEVSVTNHGPSRAAGVTLTDTLPAGTFFADASTGCTHANGVVTCNVGEMGAGTTSATYAITVTLASNLNEGTTLTNSVTAAATTPDRNSTNDTATAQTIVSTDPTPFQADLRLIKNSPATIDAGALLMYVVTVINDGGLDATHVVMTDPLPANTTFNVDHSDVSCSEAEGLVTCHLGDLPAHTRRYVAIAVNTLPWQAQNSVFVNRATVSADQDDWNPGNNTDDARTQVTTSADLRLTKTAPSTAETGNTVEYTLEIYNRGPSVARNVRLTDVLPSGVLFVEAVPSAGTCINQDNTVTCSLGDLGLWKQMTVVITAIAGDGGTQTNTANVTSDVADPDITNNTASASTDVTTKEPESHTIGQVTVTANAFVDLGGNRMQAIGDIRLGEHYRLEGGNVTLDYNDNSLAGVGTLVLNEGEVSLFRGNFTGDGDTGLLTPAEGSTSLWTEVAGFDLETPASVTEVNLLSGQATGKGTLVIDITGLNATIPVAFSMAPGPTFSGSVDPFDVTLAGCDIAVSAATLTDLGVTINTSTLTLPEKFGGQSAAFSGLTITPSSVYASSGSVTFPDILFGEGTHLWITEVAGTFVYAFGEFVLQASGTVVVSIPQNVQRISAKPLFLDSKGNLSGQVEDLELKVAGGTLTLSSLTLNNDGLFAASAELVLPSNMGGGTMYLTDIPVTKDGVDVSSVLSFTLPDFSLGNKATFTNMRTQLVKTENGLTLSITGTLKLFLPQNNQSIDFSAQIDTQGNFKGSLDQLSLTLASLTLKLTDINFDNTSISAAQGSLTLPPSLGGVTGFVNNIRIDSNGLSIGGGGISIPLPDFKMVGDAFSVTDASLTFEISTDRTFKVTIAGTISLAVKKFSATTTASITVDSQGNISGSVESFSISIVGFGLLVEGATITEEGFFASKAALQVPSGWGDVAVEVQNIRIGSDGVSIGGGKFKLPDIKVGKVTLGGLEGWFIEEDGGYEIGAGGKFFIPGLGGGASCGISVSVTFYIDAKGRTVARIEPPAQPATGPSLNEVASAGNMHPANFTPEDVAEIEGFALRNVTVGLTGCSIPIGNTGLYLTEVSGSLTLNKGTTRIDLSVTISGGPRILNTYAISGKIGMGVQFNPFELDLAGGIDLFSIFKLATMEATIRKNLFSATLHIVQIWPPLEGEASLTIWTDDGFHLVGRATVTLGFSKGALGKACVPEIGWPCVKLPPVDLRLAQVCAEFGEFIKGQGTTWGLKAEASILVMKKYNFSIGIYFDAGGTLHVGNVDEYHLVTPPAVTRIRALREAIERGDLSLRSLSPQERDLFQALTFDGDDIYVSIPVATPTDMFVLFSQVTGRPSISLIRPDGLEITPENAPANVGFEEDVLTDETADGTVRTANQTLIVIKQAMPGTWRVRLAGPIEQEDTYVLQINGIDPAPTLRDLHVTSTSPTSANAEWSLTSNEITTTLNIYATTGPITTTQIITTSEGLTKEVTIPFFTGTPVARAVSTPLDGTPGQVTLDLSHLKSGTYHFWFDANDGRNPPIRQYAPETIQVTHPWSSTWTAGTQVTSDYRQLTLSWNRNPHPDTDGYRLQVRSLPEGMTAQGIHLAPVALNTPPEIEVGDVLSTTLYNLAPGQPYYISVLAVDEDTGQTSVSEEIVAVPEGAPFDLHSDTTDLVLVGGETVTITIRVTTNMIPYPATVSLRPGDLPDGITLLPVTDIITPTAEGVPVDVAVQTTVGIPEGTYIAPLVAQGGGKARTLPLNITVQEPSFALSAEPNAVTLGPGEQARVTLHAHAIHGGQAPIHLSLNPAGLPHGLLYNFSEVIVPLDGSTTLVLTDTQRLAAGEYMLKLTGRDGAHTKELTIPLTVNKPGFSLRTARNRKVVLAGETVTYTLDLEGTAWQEPVTLSMGAGVSGTTWQFVAQPGDVPTDTITLTVPAQAYLIAALSPDAREGSYGVNVEAISGENRAFVPLELVITSRAKSVDLAVTSSESQDVLAGGRYVYTLTVTNYGPVTATHVVLTDTLPAEHTALASVQARQGTCTAAGQGITCSLGDLPPEAQVDAIVELTVDSSAPQRASLSHTARTSASEEDLAPLNNQDTGHAFVKTQSNLRLSLSDGGAPVLAGTPLTYQITVVNEGPSDAPNVIVEDTLPPQTQFMSVSPSQGTCTTANHHLTCHLDLLPDGAEAHITLQAQVAATAGHSLTNRATVRSSAQDPSTADNEDQVETRVLYQANLHVSASNSPELAVAGRLLAYTFLVANQGPSTAEKVVLDVELPPNTTFIPDKSSRMCALRDGVLSCTLGNLANGEGVPVVVTIALAPEMTGVLTSSARVHSTVDDPQPENNATRISSPVAALADMALTLTDSPDPVTAGQAITYTLLVSNTGPSHATGVSVEEMLPTGMRFLSVTTGQGHCEEVNGLVRCDLGNVAAHTSITVVVTGLSDFHTRGGHVRNTARVMAETEDTNTANNEDVAVTTVFPGQVWREFLPVAMR